MEKSEFQIFLASQKKINDFFIRCDKNIIYDFSSSSKFPDEKYSEENNFFNEFNFMQGISQQILNK